MSTAIDRTWPLALAYYTLVETVGEAGKPDDYFGRIIFDA
jgi:hypothetical protein